MVRPANWGGLRDGVPARYVTTEAYAPTQEWSDGDLREHERVRPPIQIFDPAATGPAPPPGAAGRVGGPPPGVAAAARAGGSAASALGGGPPPASRLRSVRASLRRQRGAGPGGGGGVARTGVGEGAASVPVRGPVLPYWNVPATATTTTGAEREQEQPRRGLS
eukprot:1183644-Prorocentrum_minimum.AAC.3